MKTLAHEVRDLWWKVKNANACANYWRDELMNSFSRRWNADREYQCARFIQARKMFRRWKQRLHVATEDWIDLRELLPKKRKSYKEVAEECLRVAKGEPIKLDTLLTPPQSELLSDFFGMSAEEMMRDAWQGGPGPVD